MRAVKMLNSHNPSAGQFGDCVRTALASLLEIDASEVPHYMGEFDGETAWSKTDEWLTLNHGLGLFYVGVPAITVQQVLNGMAETNPGIYYLLCGKSSNGGMHCVVCLDNRIVHDPSWFNIGIVGPADIETSEGGHYLIVVLIPALLKA